MRTLLLIALLLLPACSRDEAPEPATESAGSEATATEAVAADPPQKAPDLAARSAAPGAPSLSPRVVAQGQAPQCAGVGQDAEQGLGLVLDQPSPLRLRWPIAGCMLRHAFVRECIS